MAEHPRTLPRNQQSKLWQTTALAPDQRLRRCRVLHSSAGVTTSSHVAVNYLTRGSWRSRPDEKSRRKLWFFEADIRGFEFQFFFKTSELLKFSRQHVDRTVFLNDQNCYWQSICSEEIVHSRFFSAGRIGFRSHFWWALNFDDLFVTRPFLVGLWCYIFFLKTMNKEYLLQKTGRVGRPPPVSSCV